MIVTRILDQHVCYNNTNSYTLVKLLTNAQFVTSVLAVYHIYSGIKNCTQERSPIYKCSDCAKCFGDLSNLQRHKRMHTGEKPFKCTECDMCFSQSWNLKQHKKTHIDQHQSNKEEIAHERPFKCTECGKGFLRAADLRGHKRTHSGERPYQCSQCDKCFTYLSHVY